MKFKFTFYSRSDAHDVAQALFDALEKSSIMDEITLEIDVDSCEYSHGITSIKVV